MNELYRKVIDTPSRVDSTKKLSDTLKNLIGLERQAWNMADNANGDADAPKDLFQALQSIDDLKRDITEKQKRLGLDGPLSTI